MTANLEIVKTQYSMVAGKYGGQLIFPSEYVRSELVSTMLEMPSEADLYTQATQQKYPIGTQLRKNGGLFRRSLAGATNTERGFLKGNYFQVPGKAGNNVNSGFEGAMYADVVAGDTSFKIADTAAAKNEYEGAILVVYNDTELVYDQYTVIANDVTNATTTTCYIAPPGFKVAITTGQGVTVYRNEYMGIRGYATCGSYGTALGYAKFTITSGYYFWLQTAGRISGVTGASTWPGQTAYQRDVYCNTDGSLIGITSTTYLYQRVGFLLHRTASDYGDNTIMLQLDQ